MIPFLGILSFGFERCCIILSHVAEALRCSALKLSRAMVLLCGKHGSPVKEKNKAMLREKQR